MPRKNRQSRRTNGCGRCLPWTVEVMDNTSQRLSRDVRQRQIMIERQSKGEWLEFMVSTIQGLERHLRPCASPKDLSLFRNFKRTAQLAKTSRDRKLLEDSVDAFVESAAHITKAANRHISDISKRYLAEANGRMRMMKKLAAKHKRTTKPNKAMHQRPALGK